VFRRPHTGRLSAILLVSVYVMGSSACTEDAATPSPDVRCVPGRSVACDCPGGETGHRVCSREGVFGDCLCEPSAIGDADTTRPNPPDSTDAGPAELDIELIDGDAPADTGPDCSPSDTRNLSSGCPDADDDGLADSHDNCPDSANSGQADLDDDGDGDRCDGDIDGDADANDQDCQPRDSSIGPSQPEQCDRVDHDCSGSAIDVGELSADDIVGYWPFEEFDAGDESPEQSGSNVGPAGVPSSANAPTVESGVLGKAAAFSGSEALTIDHHPAFELAKATVAFWFRPRAQMQMQDDDPSGLWTKDAKSAGDGGHLSLMLDDNGSHLKARFQGNSERDAFTSSHRGLALGEWHHVAYAFGDGQLELHVDGERVATEASDFGWETATLSNGEPIVVGTNGWASDSRKVGPVRAYFYGRIDELIIADTKVTDGALADACRPGE